MMAEEWQRVKRILDAAIDMPTDDQVAFLDQACKGDSALRPEVESLLVSFANAGEFTMGTPVCSERWRSADPQTL